jgi:hypothetical protein
MTSKVVPEERAQEGSGRSCLSAIISSEEADRIEFVAVVIVLVLLLLRLL